MNKNLPFLIILFITLGGNYAFGQSQRAYAHARVNIIIPIAIVKNSDMNFGNVAVGGVGGTVILSPIGVRSTTGGVTLPAISGTISPAEFNVTGVAGSSFTITLPTTNHQVKNGSNVMIINNFTSSPSGTSTIGTTGRIIKVGATLNIAPLQAPGTYTSVTPFEVRVNY